MIGRPPALTYPKLRVVDEWMAQGVRNKDPSARVLAAQLGCSVSVLYAAAARIGAYRDCPKAKTVESSG